MRSRFGYSLSAVEDTAERLLKEAADVRVILFNGEMGSGKTTLIKALCKRLGTTETGSSPTYGIINEYGISGSVVYHMDLYRLKDIEEALSIGIEEYLDSGRYCFIEWPDVIRPILPDNFIEISLEREADNSRKITIFKE